MIEKTETDERDRPIKDVIIVGTGVTEESNPYPEERKASLENV